MYRKQIRYMHSLLLVLLLVAAAVVSASHVHSIELSVSERYESCGVFHAVPLDQAYTTEGPSLYSIVTQFQTTNYSFQSSFIPARYKPSPRAPPTLS